MSMLINYTLHVNSFNELNILHGCISYKIRNKTVIVMCYDKNVRQIGSTAI